MISPDLTRPPTASAVARAVGRWLVALVALLVATSFGALEVGGARAYDGEGDANVIAAASADATPEGEPAAPEVPEERDEDEERDEERDDDERTDPVFLTRGRADTDGAVHGLHGRGARGHRALRQERGERCAHARMIDRPPHA